MRRKYPPWYQVRGLKHVTGFLTGSDKKKLQRLAKAADKSLTHYVTRLLEKHIIEEQARGVLGPVIPTKRQGVHKLSTEHTRHFSGEWFDGDGTEKRV